VVAWRLSRALVGEDCGAALSPASGRGACPLAPLPGSVHSPCITLQCAFTPIAPQNGTTIIITTTITITIAIAKSSKRTLLALPRLDIRATSHPIRLQPPPPRPPSPAAPSPAPPRARQSRPVQPSPPVVPCPPRAARPSTEESLRPCQPRPRQ